MGKEKESKRELLSRPLVIIGGAMALIFGLLTAFIPGLAYVRVWVFAPLIIMITPAVEYFPFDFQIHGYTSGLLISSIGGFLGLTAALMRVNRRAYLGFMGNFLGFLGFLSLLFSPLGESAIPEVHYFWVPWVGTCLTLIGISLMFVGTMVESREWHHLTLLGIPLILTSLLTHPLLIAVNNLPLLLSIHRNMSINVLFGYLILLGFALTFFGTVIGFWKSAQNWSK